MGQAALPTPTNPPSPILPRERLCAVCKAGDDHTGAAEFAYGDAGSLSASSELLSQMGDCDLTIVITVEVRVCSASA